MLLKTLLGRGLWFAHLGWLLRQHGTSLGTRTRPFMIFEGRTYTYGETYEGARRFAELFSSARRQHIAAGHLAEADPLAVGIYQENTPELVMAVLGAALSGSLVFGLNTGFRGATLGGVIERAGIRLLLTGQRYVAELEKALPADPAWSPAAGRVLLNEAAAGVAVTVSPYPSVAQALAQSRRAGPSRRIDNQAPFLVIYTSGTTGAPKGVVCSQLKLIGAGLLTLGRVWLRPSDRGYVCMPLFHSNAWFLGIMPLLLVGGSFVLRRRFSARAFEQDLLDYGITYLSYVGQPIHYIVAALEERHGGGAAVERALARHPDNRFRLAHGNGATPLDRAKLTRYLGMEHIYELYGSTEAAISTVVRPGDPPDSVGRVRSRKIVILGDGDVPCPAGVTDETGRLLNYREAVGEIARRIGADNLFFDGYFNDDGATASKYRAGYFRSGDLGHIRIIRGRRYLYFNGRTSDWIRKDGENFSADNVAKYAAEHDGVAQAIAYGAPDEVSDERVMVALELLPGACFDPAQTFDRFERQQAEGGMDPKWLPDYIRVVARLELTQTQKILTGSLKRRHFKPDRDDEPVFYRRRGDRTFERLDGAAYADLVRRFEANGRGHLL